MKKLKTITMLLLAVTPKAAMGAPFTVGRRTKLEVKGRVMKIDYSSRLLHFRGGGKLSDSSIESTLSELKESNRRTSETENAFIFTLNQPGDGHEKEPFIPRRFIKTEKGNVENANAAYKATLSWRTSNDVDSILGRPHPTYDIFKKVVPHFFFGPDSSGHIIFCQRPGLLRLELLPLNNVTREEFLMHYVYILEFCWNVLEPHPDQTMTSILDGTGLNLRTVQKLLSFIKVSDVPASIDYAKKAILCLLFNHSHAIKDITIMMSRHYPQRSHKTLIINAPSWVGTIYKLISPVLRESTKEKISIWKGGVGQEEVLKAILGDVPRELSVKGRFNGCDSVYERHMRAFVLSRLRESGVDMRPVIES